MVEHRGKAQPRASKPAPKDRDLLTRRALADRLSVHMMTVTKWEREGMPIAQRGSKGRSSFYSEVDVRAWLTLREEGAKRQSIDFAQARARKELAQAIEAEQRVAIRARDLLPKDEVEKAWAAECAAIRTVILASYTTHADRVHRAATLDGVLGVEQALKEIAYDVLRELTNPAPKRKRRPAA